MTSRLAHIIGELISYQTGFINGWSIWLHRNNLWAVNLSDIKCFSGNILLKLT